MTSEEVYEKLVVQLRQLEDRLVDRLRGLEDELSCLSNRTNEEAEELCPVVGFTFEAVDEFDEDGSEFE